MQRLCVVVGVAVSTGALAFGQQDASARLASVTSPVRHAGVYHVATGTWTRSASLANLGGAGPDTIYDNTCAAVYFVGMSTNESFQHRSRLPSLSSPLTRTIVPGRPFGDTDSVPGCANSYLVNGFQVAYCSSSTSTIDWRYQFASNYTDCAGSDMIPKYTIDLFGLPGGTPSGAQNCWIVDIDLSGGTGGGILLSADGDGTYNGTPDTDEFGFSFGPLSPVTGTSSGPLIAGDFTWTGGPGTVSGVLTPCTGTDGTIWDDPVDLSEEGTGMGSLDFFRSVISIPSTAGCYSWRAGNNPHSDFWLELYADANCPPMKGDPGFCYPNAGGTRSCPCGNQPVPNNGTRGCNNFGPNPPGGTGGARLTATGHVFAGTATTLVFHVFGMQTPSTIVVLLAGSTQLSPGVIAGAGVRCVGGIQTPRPYKSIAGFNAGGIDFPSADATPNVDAWTRSNSPLPGTVRHYYAAYRNSAAGSHSPCTPANAFNLTNAGTIMW